MKNTEKSSLIGEMFLMKLIVITGMPGAGKSEIADAFSSIDIPIIVMGDVIRDEVRERGQTPDSENTKRVMLELREKDGLGAIAIHCVKRLKEIDSEIVVIEGCRSIHEVDVFDDYAAELVVIGVHSAPVTRFKRLQARGRKDAPLDWKSFRERDLREISVGLGGIFALSNLMILNEGTIEELREAAREVVEKVC
jgi:dephospho-CoA kinase